MRGRLTLLAALAGLVAVGCGTGAGGVYTPPAIAFGIAGRITDATNSAALSGATVSVSSGNSVLGTATTNSTGDYNLPNLSSTTSTVTWTVSAPTYRSFSTSINVTGGGSYSVNYSMARQVGSVSGNASVSVTALPAASGLHLHISNLLRNPPTRAAPYAPDQLLVKFKST